MILFSTVLLICIEQYLTEKRMFIETETILKQDYYLLTTVKKLESTFAATELTPGTGSFAFNGGQADYSMLEFADRLWEITIKIKTGTGVEIIGFAYYDQDRQKMIKWIEKN